MENQIGTARSVHYLLRMASGIRCVLVIIIPAISRVRTLLKSGREPYPAVKSGRQGRWLWRSRDRTYRTWGGSELSRLVLVRHGQSQWNLENRFTGWTDVDLSDHGVEEARQAGRLLKDQGIFVDVAFTSVLKRSIKTLDIILEETDLLWIPVTKAWELNERHYGALQGLNKAETANKYGAGQVAQWRRSYSTLPPLLEDGDPRLPEYERKYREVDRNKLPRGESLAMTVKRVMPFWESSILPALAAGQTPLIVAHGNSLRALIKSLDQVSDEDIVGVEIPTGSPIVYEFDQAMAPSAHYYLEATP